MPVRGLGIAAGEVEDQAVVAFAQGEVHLPDVVALNEGRAAPGTVGELADPLPQHRLGVTDDLRRHPFQEVRAVLLGDFLYPGLGDVVGGDLALEVQPHHHGLPRHVEDSVEDVPAELAAFHQLETRHPHPLVANLRGPGRVAARGHGADVHHVDEGGAPGDAAAFVVDRGDDVDVRLVDGRHVRVVQEEDIVGVDALALLEPLYDLLHREAGAGHVLAQGLAGRQHVAVRGVERRHVVVLLRGVHRAAHPLQGDPHLPGDLVQPVRQDLQGNGVDGVVAAGGHATLRGARAPRWTPTGATAGRPYIIRTLRLRKSRCCGTRPSPRGRWGSRRWW